MKLKKVKEIALAGSIALQSAVLSQTSDPALKAVLTVSSFALMIPYAMFAELYKLEAEDVIKEILQSGKIKQELFASPEFQQSLGNLFENLRRLKEKEKRDLINRAFLGAYISEDEYTKDYLERIQDVSMRISIRALQHLGFVKNEILPLLEKEAKSFMGAPQAGYTPDAFKIHKMHTISISQFYDEYHNQRRKDLETNLNKNYTEETRRIYDLAGAEEQKRRLRFVEFWTEFNTLGIFRQGNDPAIGTAGGGSGTVQYLTEFGREYIRYVSSDTRSVEEYTFP